MRVGKRKADRRDREREIKEKEERRRQIDRKIDR